jgi:hypothetical protein
MKKIISLAFIIFIISLSTHASELVNLRIHGRITNETFKELNQALSEIEKNKQKIILNAVQLDSNGGSGEAARQIGKLIRQKKLNTYVGKSSSCDSACVFILIGGVQRYAFGEVGVHRSTFAIEVPNDKFVKPFIEETVKLNTDYIKSMGISMMLSDAMETTESWKIRSLTEVEKRQWQVFGTDRLEEELLFNQIARERHISRNEFINIFKTNYDDCLKDAEQLKNTVFECAKSKTHKPHSITVQLLAWVSNKLDVSVEEQHSNKSHSEQVIEIKNKIRDNKIYLRYMSISELTSLAASSSKKLLSAQEVAQLEKTNKWWVEGNTINVLVSNPSNQQLNEIQFNLSTTDCQSKGTERVLRMSLTANLEERNSAVYSGQLPFNYDKIIGKGTRCGVIKAASY